MNRHSSFSRSGIALLWAGIVLAALLFRPASARGADESKQDYHIPAAEATIAFRQFTAVSGYDILFAADAVRGVRTAAISGEFVAKEALDGMLVGTKLTAVEDAKNRTFSVRLNGVSKNENKRNVPGQSNLRSL